jgi:hypothetical protein
MKKLFVPLLTLLCTFFASAVAFADVPSIYPYGMLDPEPSSYIWRTPEPTPVPPIYLVLEHLPTLILMAVALIVVSVALWFLLKYRRK